MTALSVDVKQNEQQSQTQKEVIETNKPESNSIQKNEQNTQQNNEPAAEKESAEDPNWKAFREARKRDRAEKEAAERRAAEKEAEAAALKAAMEAAFSKSSPTPQAYQQYYGMNQDPEETEEQRIDRKVSELLNKKEQEYIRQQMEEEQRTYPNRLNKDFPDFKYICSQENLDYLDYHYPEVSRPLQRLSDGYDKWHDIYHAVKKFIPNHSNAKKEAMRADINQNKPRSISSMEITQSGQPVRASQIEMERARSENWARMQRVMKGV